MSLDQPSTMALDNPATTDRPSSPDEDEPSPLQRLPAELRAAIFAYAITEPNPIDISFETTSSGSLIPVSSDQDNPCTGIALTQTCNQFRREVLPMIPAHNTFALALPPPEEARLREVPWFLAETGEVMIYIEDFADEDLVLFNASRIHITQDPGQGGTITSVTADGYLEDRCICALEKLAEKCNAKKKKGKGKECMRLFLGEFERKRFRRWLRCSRLDTERFGEGACGVCGKEVTWVQEEWSLNVGMGWKFEKA